MGNLPLNGKNKKYKQGYYYPKNKEKFISRTGYAIYRSGLELDYFRILDNSPMVKSWGSEEVIIPYYFNEKMHKYYIDLYVEYINGQKLFIEIKPWKQTQEPHWSPRRKRENYIAECIEFEKNKAKWQSAVVWAGQVNAKFRILTEKDINKEWGK